METITHTELSEAISELAKLNAISITEHTQLIKMLSDSSPELLSSTSCSKSKEELEHNLIKLVRAWQKPGPLQATVRLNDDNTSPLDTFLQSKKQRQHVEQELKLSLANSEVESIKESQEDSPVH